MFKIFEFSDVVSFIITLSVLMLNLTLAHCVSGVAKPGPGQARVRPILHVNDVIGYPIIARTQAFSMRDAYTPHSEVCWRIRG